MLEVEEVDGAAVVAVEKQCLRIHVILKHAAFDVMPVVDTTFNT